MKQRREDWWSWQSLTRRERGWAMPPRRSDILALRWREAEAAQRREGCTATHCKTTTGRGKSLWVKNSS